MSSFTFQPAATGEAFEDACRVLQQHRFADALWTRRVDIWSDDRATQDKIAARLGWVDAIDFIQPHLPRLPEFAYWIKNSGLTDIVLLGMGGSSLCSEVLRSIIGVAPGYPRFRVLDSVDPAAVTEAMENAATSLFIVASKSGSTIEPNVLAAEAQRRVQAAGIGNWSSRFIAITDENTVLHQRADAERFYDIFINPGDVGGRYSALSFFGVVPAALMGIDFEQLVGHGNLMAWACRSADAAANPGLALGAFLAAGAHEGRDKLTLVLSPRLEPFGLWVEQLIAESTGKQGKGIVPITGEPPDAVFGPDRMAVIIRLAGEDADPDVVARARAVETPLVSIDLPNVLALGAEFVRWEVATATAGFLMEINPFDEPNVQEAKDATRALLETCKQQQTLPIPPPHTSIEGASLTVSGAAQASLGEDSAVDFLRVLKPRDYFALLAYLPPNDEQLSPVLRLFRSRVSRLSGCATTAGYGPRYLHSTGQLHKGGANNGVFVIVTAEPADDLPIPGEPYSFGVLEMAQAVGDFQALDRAGRRALHLHLPARDPEHLRRVCDALLASR